LVLGITLVASRTGTCAQEQLAALFERALQEQGQSYLEARQGILDRGEQAVEFLREKAGAAARAGDWTVWGIAESLIGRLTQAAQWKQFEAAIPRWFSSVNPLTGLYEAHAPCRGLQDPAAIPKLRETVARSGEPPSNPIPRGVAALALGDLGDKRALRPLLEVLRAVKATPVLTVWRKLHVEVDSMGAEPEGTQFDDEDLLRGDVPDPPLGALTRAMAEAYIEVSTELGQSNPATDWVYGFTGTTAMNAYFLGAGGVRGTQDEQDSYWTAYVCGAYEIGVEYPFFVKSNDPDFTGCYQGFTATTEPEYSIVGMELVRDVAAQWGYTQHEALARDIVTAHELGHQFGLKENSDVDGNPTNLMWSPTTEADEEKTPAAQARFLAKDIDAIRTEARP